MIAMGLKPDLSNTGELDPVAQPRALWPCSWAVPLQTLDFSTLGDSPHATSMGGVTCGHHVGCLHCFAPLSPQHLAHGEVIVGILSCVRYTGAAVRSEQVW